MAIPQFTLPLPAARFLKDYWQKKPLFIPQAASGLALVDGNTLGGLALEDAVDSRLVTRAADGQWQAKQGPFDESTLTHLPNKDWTLLVQSVDYYLTEVSLLLDCFSFLPAWRLEDIMISYAAPGGSVGAHFDQYDVFLFQAQGEKHWEIGQQCNAQTPLQPNDSLKLLRDFQPTSEYTMKPGDVLYLPPGVAHCGTATSEDCITWSVGFRAPDLYQLIDWLLAESEANRTATLFADANRLPATDIGLHHTDSQAMLTQAWQALTALPTHELLANWLSLPRQETLELLDVDGDALRTLLPDAALVRHGGTRLLLEDNQASRAWINGNAFDIEPDAQPLVKLLAQKRIVTGNELAAATQYTAAHNLLQTWIAAGYLYELQ